MAKRRVHRRRPKRRRAGMVRHVSNAYKTFTADIQSVVTVTATGATTAFNVVYNFPSYWINNAGTWAAMGAITPNLAKFIDLFDQYVVKRLKVVVTPQYMENSPTTALVTAAQPCEVYHMNDLDDFNLMTEVQALNSGQMTRSLVQGRPCSFIMTRRQQNRLKYNTALLNTVTPTTALADNRKVLPTNPFGTLKLLIPNTVNTEVNVRITGIWTVLFSNIVTR